MENNRPSTTIYSIVKENGYTLSSPEGPEVIHDRDRLLRVLIEKLWRADVAAGRDISAGEFVNDLHEASYEFLDSLE